MVGVITSQSRWQPVVVPAFAATTRLVDVGDAWRALLLGAPPTRL